MTLLDAKASTPDIDFTGPARDIDEFQKVDKTLPHGFKMDLWKDGHAGYSASSFPTTIFRIAS